MCSGMSLRKNATISIPVSNMTSRTSPLPTRAARLPPKGGPACGSPIAARNRSVLLLKRLKTLPSLTPARSATSAVVAWMPRSRKTWRAASMIVSSLMLTGRAMA